MESPTHFEGSPEVESPSVELWKMKEGRKLSALVITDFSDFLLNQPEHHTGDMVCGQVNTSTANQICEVRCFGDSPGKDDVFHVNTNFGDTLEVTTVQGDAGKINALLEGFGMVPVEQG
jgi:hypothetical protein